MQDLIFESDDVMEFKIVPTLITGGHFNHDKSMIFRQLAGVVSRVQKLMMAQKYIPRISNGFAKIQFSPRTTNKICVNLDLHLYFSEIRALLGHDRLYQMLKPGQSQKFLK